MEVSEKHSLSLMTGNLYKVQGILKFCIKLRAQLFEGRLALNPELNLTLVSFSCVQKHFLG